MRLRRAPKRRWRWRTCSPAPRPRAARTTPAAAPDIPTYVLLAVDGGPRETLLPLAAACDIPLEDVPSPDAAGESHWRSIFQSRTAHLLVVGTSDSAGGRRIEAAARRAARRASLPVVAIEDFPGNYASVTDGEASLVLVESAAARDLCLRRLGRRAAPVEIMSPARYDAYRARLGKIRQVTTARREAATRALWAGQPETQDGVRTLEVLLPVLRAHRVELLFKAHPRDPGYAVGTYHRLLEGSGVAFEDVTAASVLDALDAAPRLVVTQSSSVAIEAGFYGIPALCVLLPDAGGARLLEKKGYDVPLFCTAGAAAFARESRDVEPAFARALSDESFRNGLIGCFDRYFEVYDLKTSALLQRLQRATEERK